MNSTENYLDSDSQESDSIEEIKLPPSTRTVWRKLPFTSSVINPVKKVRKTRHNDRLSSDEDEQSYEDKQSRIKIRASVAKSYRKENKTELSLTEGEKITITSPPDNNGMAFGYKRTKLKTKKKGFIPVKCVSDCQGFW